LDVFAVAAVEPSCPDVVPPVTLVVGIFATLVTPHQSHRAPREMATHFVPPNAKIMNNTVPTYSPIMAMKSIRVPVCRAKTASGTMAHDS